MISSYKLKSHMRFYLRGHVRTCDKWKRCFSTREVMPTKIEKAMAYELPRTMVTTHNGQTEK